MILRDHVVLILDVVAVLIQGDFVVVLGSSKYAGKGQPLKRSISSCARTNIHANPMQNASRYSCMVVLMLENPNQ